MLGSLVLYCMSTLADSTRLFLAIIWSLDCFVTFFPPFPFFLPPFFGFIWSKNALLHFLFFLSTHSLFLTWFSMFHFWLLKFPLPPLSVALITHNYTTKLDIQSSLQLNFIHIKWQQIIQDIRANSVIKWPLHYYIYYHYRKLQITT